MKTWSEKAPTLRTERHFGDRVLQCFAERPGGLLQMLEEAVQRNAAGEALVCGDARLSWRELQDRVARAAGLLAQRGICRGDRVALLLGNRVEFPLAFLGAAWLGAICVPIGIREQKPGLEYILRHCGASLLVYDAELAARLPDDAAAPALRTRLAAEEFSSLIASGKDPTATPSGEDDTAAILYTSGT